MSLLRFRRRQATGAVSSTLLVLMLACGHKWSVAAAAAIPAPMSNVQQSGTAIVFYAQPQVSEELWPALFQALRADLAEGAGALPSGLVLDKDPIVLRGDQDLQGVIFSKIISVKLLGRCDMFPQPDRPWSQGPLGWVMQVSGTVQPFVSIDCTRIAQVLRPKATSFNKEGRRDAMTQAIAHVLIHEWIHIATQSSSHSARGLTRANLSVNELIASPKGSSRLSSVNR
jgi:hypothetical protein